MFLDGFCMHLVSCLQMLSVSCRMKLGKFYCQDDPQVSGRSLAALMYSRNGAVPVLLECCISWVDLLCQTLLPWTCLITTLHLLDGIAELVFLLEPFPGCIHLNNWEPVPLNPSQFSPTVPPLAIQILNNRIVLSEPYSPCEWFKIWC